MASSDTIWAYALMAATSWQDDLNQRMSAAITTVPKTNTATFVPIDKSAIWGQNIPLSWGHVIIDAPIMQLGPLRGEWGERYNDWGYSDGAGTTAWGYSINIVYKCDIAAALGYNGNPSQARTIKRIWVDGYLAYDEAATNLNMAPWYFVPQSELTTPPFQFYQGLSNPVAYRGLQYLMLLDYVVQNNMLNINRMSNDLPKIRVEMYDYTVPVTPSTTYTPLTTWSGTINGDSTVYDSRTQLMYSIDTSNVIHVWDAKTQSEVSRYDFTDPSHLFSVPINYGENDDGCLVRGWLPEQVYLSFETGLNNGVEIGIANLLTGEVIAHFGAQALFPTNTYSGNRIRSNLNHYPFYAGVVGNQRSYVLITTQTSGSFIWNICDEQLGVSGQFTYVMAQENVANPFLHISQESIILEDGSSKFLVVYGGGTSNQYGFLTIDVDGRFSFGALGTPANEASTTWGATFKTADKCFVVFETSGGVNKIKKFDGLTGALLKTINSGFNWPTPNQLWMQSETNGRAIAWLINTGGTRVVQRLDMLNMTITSYSVGTYSWGEQLLYDAMTNSFYNPNLTDGLNQLNVAPTTQGAVSLSSILSGICQAKGYAPGNITITGITDQVIGAILPARFDLDQVLNDLAKVYNFTYINRDGNIIISRATTGSGFAATWDVYETDLIPFNDDGDDLNGVSVKHRRLTDSKVPSKTELTYIDYNYNYQASTYTYQRPQGTNLSNTAQSFTIPIVMDQDTAAALVTRMTYDAWAARTEKDFRLSKKFLAMEPGDTVNLHLPGYIDTVRVKEVTIGVNYELEIKAEGMQTVSGPVIVTSPYDDVQTPSLPGDGLTNLLIIDTPALTVGDVTGDVESPVYYACVPAGRGTFDGAIIYRADGPTAPYTKFATANGEPIWGKLRTTLPTDYWLGIDRLLELELQPYGGDTTQFVSVTRDQMLAGANRILIGQQGRWELVGFETVTWRAGRLYISGILRGMRGTDVNLANHAAGDIWILVDNDTAVLETQESIDSFGDTIYLKACGRKLSLALAPRKSFTFNANGRKPFAPINTTVADNGTGQLTISWTRRNRTEESFVDLVASPSTLDEASEAYELEIYNGSTLVRTVTGLTSPTYTYTTANQTSDGFSPPLTSLRIKVYQISAAVGRGFARDVTEDVKQP